MRRFLTAAAMLGLMAGAARAQYTYTPFDAPGATTTLPFGINNAGQIVGDADSAGFFFDGASFHNLNAPGATSTFASGLNNLDQIVGTYGIGSGPNSISHGYLLSGGTYTPIDEPGADITQSLAINDSGVVAGWVLDVNTHHGFLYSGGTFTPFDGPGGNTFLNGINDSGQLVGSSNNGPFLYSGGTFTPIHVPGSLITQALGINNLGDVVGDYVIGGHFHGYVYHGGTYTTFDAPGAVNTRAFGINDAGQVVVAAQDSNRHPLSFVATPTPVPEPATFTLTGIGVLGLLGYARWRARA